MCRVSFYLLVSINSEKLNKFNLLGKEVQEQIGKTFQERFYFPQQNALQ